MKEIITDKEFKLPNWMRLARGSVKNKGTPKNKKILWCGSSHLANCMPSIKNSEIFSKTENQFYLTGGPKIKDWCLNGKGRYKVDGTVVGGNGHDPSKSHDLAAYDAIIFVGQLLGIQNFVSGPSPLSKSLLDNMFPYDKFPIYIPWGGNWLFNEPLALFPKLAPGKCYLAVDPISNYDLIKQVPINVKKYFLDRIREFCDGNDIRVMFQPKETLDDDLTTKRVFNRKENDCMHMNDDFYRLYLAKSVAPALNIA